VRALRKAKVFIVIFTLAVIFGGAFSVMTADRVEARRCCWVMVCTIDPPVYCWEECRPCPPFPLP
jgi:hypothetical protein